VIGIGPQIGHIFPINKDLQGYLNLKAYGEFANARSRCSQNESAQHQGTRHHLCPRSSVAALCARGEGLPALALAASWPESRPGPGPAGKRRSHLAKPADSAKGPSVQPARSPPVKLGGRVGTIAVTGMTFKRPVFVGNEVSWYAEVIRSGAPRQPSKSASLPAAGVQERLSR
jgi:hypothetical protein